MRMLGFGGDLSLGRLPGVAGLIRSDCLQIRPSSILGAGEGLFTTCTLGPAEVIALPYSGPKMKMKEVIEKGYQVNGYVWCTDALDGTDALKGQETMCVDAKNATGAMNPARYVNGARTKKQSEALSIEMCQLDGDVYYRTTRVVQPEAELLVDYGPIYWNEESEQNATSSPVAAATAEADAVVAGSRGRRSNTLPVENPAQE